MEKISNYPEIWDYKLSRILIVLLFLSAFLFSWGYAAPLMTISPRLGSGELDFGQVSQVYQEASREVDVEISATAAQYELRQEPLSSLRNSRGDIIPWINFTVRGVTGTNKFGRLKVNFETVTSSVIYTSSQSGSPDSFTLLYNFRAPDGAPPDFYRGQLRFVLTPVNSGQEQITVILNVTVVIGPGSELSKPSLEIIPGGSGIIYLNSRRPETSRQELLVKINGSFSKPFTLKQILLKPFESLEGERLEPAAVNVEARSAREGTGIPLTSLSLQPQIIYKSKPTGEADKNFGVSFSLDGAGMRKAGRFRSTIQYVLEEMGLELQRQTLEIEVENERIFDLVITSPSEGGAIEFNGLKPGEPQISEVVVEIRSNTGKRYQLNQNILSELADKQGNKIENKYFTFRTESMQTKGTLKAVQKQEAGKGGAILYISDSQGSDDKFKIIYELEDSLDIKAGDYATRISYSLLEI